MVSGFRSVLVLRILTPLLINHGSKTMKQSSNPFDELTKKLGSMIPPEGEMLIGDLKRYVRTAINGAVKEMDLVTREEFDIQTKVLARTRERLEALELRVEELENSGERT